MNNLPRPSHICIKPKGDKQAMSASRTDRWHPDDDRRRHPDEITMLDLLKNIGKTLEKGAYYPIKPYANDRKRTPSTPGATGESGPDQDAAPAKAASAGAEKVGTPAASNTRQAGRQDQGCNRLRLETEPQQNQHRPTSTAAAYQAPQSDQYEQLDPPPTQPQVDTGYANTQQGKEPPQEPADDCKPDSACWIARGQARYDFAATQAGLRDRARIRPGADDPLDPIERGQGVTHLAPMPAQAPHPVPAQRHDRS